MTAPKLPRRPISVAAQQVADEAASRPAPDSGRIVSSRPDGTGRQGLLGTKIRERAAMTGPLPHEILLKLARGEPIYQRILNPETGEVRLLPHYPDIKTMVDAAKAASPYYAPKLSAVQTIPGATDDELDQFIASLTAETSASAGAAGEEEEGDGEGAES